MKHRSLPLTLLALVACAAETDDPLACGAAAIAPDVGLVLTTTYETSSLDVFTAGCPDAIRKNLLVAGGDAVLRRRASGAFVLNRGADDNIVFVGASLTPEAQLSLAGCGPHDALELPDGRTLVSCYEDTHLRVIDSGAQQASRAVDLSAYADDDGLPEMDQLVLHEGKIYVSIQKLARGSGYAPSGPAVVAVLDAASLALVADITLPCEDPFTPFALTASGELAVGCVGDFLEPGRAAIASFTPGGQTSVIADEAALGGQPTALVSDAGGDLHAIVSVPDPASAFVTLEMRLVKIGAGGVATLHAYPGFTLSGLAFDSEGRVWFGNRSSTTDAGLWRLTPATGAIEGPYATGLPPLDIAIY